MYRLPAFYAVPAVAAFSGTHNSSVLGPEHLILLLMRMLLLIILSKFQSKSEMNQFSLMQIVKNARVDLKNDYRIFLKKCKNQVLLDSLSRFVGRKPTMSFEDVLQALDEVYNANAKPKMFDIDITLIIACQNLKNVLSNLFQINKSFEMLFWQKIWYLHFEIELQHDSHNKTFHPASSKLPKVRFTDVDDVKIFSAPDEVTQLVCESATADAQVSKRKAANLAVTAFIDGNQSALSTVNGTESDAAELLNIVATASTRAAFDATSAAIADLEVASNCIHANACGQSLFLPDPQSPPENPQGPPSIDPSLLRSLETLSIVPPPVSSFGIPVETDTKSSKASAIDFSSAGAIPDGDDAAEFFAVLASNPTTTPLVRDELLSSIPAQSPQQCVDDKAPRVQPVVPCMIPPESPSYNLGSTSSNQLAFLLPPGLLDRIAVPLSFTPAAHKSSIPLGGKIGGSVAHFLDNSSKVALPHVVMSENPHGNSSPFLPSGNVGEHSVQKSSSRNPGSISTSDLDKFLPPPQLKVSSNFRPCRPLPPTLVNPPSRRTNIGGSPTVAHSSSKPLGSTATTLSLPTLTYPPSRRTEIGGSPQPMLHDIVWLLLKAASCSISTASPPLWVPMNLGTRGIGSA